MKKKIQRQKSHKRLLEAIFKWKTSLSGEIRKGLRATKVAEAALSPRKKKYQKNETRSDKQSLANEKDDKQQESTF